MAEVVWAEPALADLEAIADYISLDKPKAAKALVRRVFERVERLGQFPLSGRVPPELKGSRYRQVIEPPCRILYRVEAEAVVILHVMRSERLLRKAMLAGRRK
jgi:toxin ParE1/3/4